MNTDLSGATGRPFMHAFIVLVRHWRFLSAITVCAIVVAGVVVFLMPKTYRATATFFPPQRQSSILESVTSGLNSTLKSFGIGKTNLGAGGVYSYVSVLQSRQMTERIVRKFDLISVYGIPGNSMEGALKALKDNMDVTIEDEGHVSVVVEDHDPKRAADMANAFVENLNDINTRLAASEAKANTAFLELQYKQTMASLNAVEDSFIVFQKRTKIFSLPDQSKAALTAAASAYAQLMYQQVSVTVAEKMYGAEDADVQRLKAMQTELQKAVGRGGTFGDLLPTMKDVPAEGMQYMRYYRDYEIYSKFLGFLLPMYQQAKVDEQRLAQAVVSLDPALPPEHKVKPKRLIVMLVAGASGLVLAMLYVLLRDRFAWYRAQHAAEWDQVRNAFRASA